MGHSVTVTPQEAYDMIRGAMVFPWFQDKIYFGVRENGSVSLDWEILVTFNGIAYPVNHRNVSKAIGSIIHEKAIGVSWMMRKVCIESIEYSTDVIDESEYGQLANALVQLATYGSVLYAV